MSDLSHDHYFHWRTAQGLKDYLEFSKKCGYSTGWKSLDRFYKVEKGQLNVVTGIPSHGKSEFVDALMFNMVQNEGWHVVYYSPENYPVYEHILKLTEKHQKKSRFVLTNDEISESWDYLKEFFDFIDIPYTEDPTLENIIDDIESGNRMDKLDAVVIDPWNEVELSRPWDVNETDYTGKCLRKLRKMAREMKVAFFVVAHPVKMERTKEGVFKVPTPYDISGSANWYNKPDNCLCVWRDVTKEDGEVDVFVQKVKFKPYGRPGRVKLIWNGHKGGIYEELGLNKPN